MEKSEETSEHPETMPERSDREENVKDEYSPWEWFYFMAGLLILWIIPMDVLDQDNHGFVSIYHVMADALFLYVPLINEDTKCVTVDNRLKIAALVLRSFSDLRYLVRIIRLVRKRESLSLEKIAKSIALEILALLPIPQVVVLVFHPNMRGSNALKIMKFLNSLIVLQYLVRAYPIYTLFKAANIINFDEKISYKEKFRTNRRFNIILNFFAFLLASHVLGAFFYFFSIQREIDCWGYANKFEYGSKFSTSCDGGTLANAALINKHCPINPPDASLFDFGIFLYVLQSGMQASTSFPQKFFQCFSWGLRNLSSFGSNLNTSKYGWENLFVVLISISGLILFMYLLGRVQTYMQKPPKNIREKFRRTIEPKLQDMISEYGIPENMKSKVERVVKAKLKKDKDFVVENMFSFLSSNIIKDIDDSAKSLAIEIKCSLFMDKLKKVDKIKDKQEIVLKMICEKLEPMIYNKGSHIIRQGEPLDMLFFITRGIVFTYYATIYGGSDGFSSTTIQLKKEKDDLYGEELITWGEGHSYEMFNLPISDITVKCHNEVEVFTLSASDLQFIISEYPSEFNMSRTLPICIDENKTVS